MGGGSSTRRLLLVGRAPTSLRDSISFLQTMLESECMGKELETNLALDSKLRPDNLAQIPVHLLHQIQKVSNVLLRLQPERSVSSNATRQHEDGNGNKASAKFESGRVRIDLEHNIPILINHNLDTDNTILFVLHPQQMQHELHQAIRVRPEMIVVR